MAECLVLGKGPKQFCNCGQAPHIHTYVVEQQIHEPYQALVFFGRGLCGPHQQAGPQCELWCVFHQAHTKDLPKVQGSGSLPADQEHEPGRPGRFVTLEKATKAMWPAALEKALAKTLGKVYPWKR